MEVENKTEKSFLFIDLVIMNVKKNPLIPIMVPVMSNRFEFVIRPKRDVMKPDNEFSIEMIMDISVFLMDRTKVKPKKDDKKKRVERFVNGILR